MVRNLLIALLISNALFADQGSGDQTNYTDPNGLKQGHWIYKNDVKKLPNYDPAAKVEEGDYKDNKKMGMWVQYWPNGNKKSEISFDNNKAKGYAKMYFEDGKVMEEGTWENNRWTGDYKMYHPNGQLFYEFKYSPSGKREGVQTYFHDNGKVMMKGEMKDGKETGEWEERYENGDLKSKKVFNNGSIDPTQTKTYVPKNVIVDNTPDPEPKGPNAPKVDVKKENVNKGSEIKIFDGNGKYKLFNMNKQISKDGVFKNYQLIDGKDYIYNKDGILVQIAVYKGGKYIGDAPLEEQK
jgi:antitoxin component YwqK of YwqJK toxin-antitoxin module